MFILVSFDVGVVVIVRGYTIILEDRKWKLSRYV